MRRFRWLVPLGCCLTFVPGFAQTVTTKAGNICVSVRSSQVCRQLTNAGIDRDPSLSPDNSLVVFVRNTPGRMVARPTGNEADETELWTIGADGREPHLVLRGGSAKGSNGVPIAAFSSPQFAPDGTHIYFLSMSAVVTDAVLVLDLKTHEVHEVCAGNSLVLVRNGPYAGDLIVEQHRYFLGGGSYDWVYVIAPDGREIGPLGARDDPGFAERLKEVVGDGGD